MLSYIQAIILGIVQGVTEIFPVSSLGHSVLLANLFGWTSISEQQTASSSAYLNLLAVTQIATAVALSIFYRQEWKHIGTGLLRSLKSKQIAAHDSDAKLAWLLITAAIPVGIVSLLFEHALRTTFATAFFAIIFVILNGIMLLKGDKRIAKAQLPRPRQRHAASGVNQPAASQTARVISGHLSYGRTVIVGMAQLGALLAGLSRSGITMIMGLRSGLDHQDAARFSYLLLTLIILAAGMYKLPGVIGHAHPGTGGPILVGGLLAGGSAYLSVRYLDKYFRRGSLRPFGWYCIGFGVLMLLISIVKGA